MALTAEQLATLKRPFARADHEFIRSFVYLTEEAITSRIEEVDPSWEFAMLQLSQTSNQAVAHARMTVCGVFRDGVGMQTINEKAGEAEKGAATDALKRCARLFGVGRYLLDAPTQDKFDAWLAQLQKAQNGAVKHTPLPATLLPTQNAPSAPVGVGDAISPNVPASSSSASTPASPPNGDVSGEPLFPPLVDGAVITPLNTEGDSKHLPRDVNGLPILGSLDMKTIGKLAQNEKLISGQYHFANLIDLLWREGDIRAASTPEAVMEAIRKHETAKDMAKEGVGAR